MLTETGRVVAVESDGIWVETLKKSSCAQCAAKSGCGQKLLAESALKDMTHIKAFFLNGEPNRIWQQGDQAQIGIEESALLRATLLAYLLPLVLLLVFAGFASVLFASELLVVISSFLGLIAGGWFVKHRSSRHGDNSIYQAKVLG